MWEGREKQSARVNGMRQGQDAASKLKQKIRGGGERSGSETQMEESRKEKGFVWPPKDQGWSSDKPS